jgi:hypothetical protein
MHRLIPCAAQQHANGDSPDCSNQVLEGGRISGNMANNKDSVGDESCPEMLLRIATGSAVQHIASGSLGRDSKRVGPGRPCRPAHSRHLNAMDRLCNGGLLWLQVLGGQVEGARSGAAQGQEAGWGT